MKWVFSRDGVPKTVMSDRGPQFSSEEFKAFANQYCFDHTTSSLRYLQSNGMIEQMVQTVKAVPEEIHGSRTWSLPSCTYLQGNTILRQPTSTIRAAEWRETQGITANKKPIQNAHRLWENKWSLIRKEVLNTTTDQQETYHPYLWSRRPMIRSTLSRTSGLQQPSPRHAQQHIQDHTLWRPRMEPTTKGIEDSSDELRKHPTWWNNRPCSQHQHHGAALTTNQETR